MFQAVLGSMMNRSVHIGVLPEGRDAVGGAVLSTLGHGWHLALIGVERVI